jgi:WD40 repeat protein
VGSLIMAVDAEGHWMATGDVDGLIKVWDISQHCLYDSPEEGEINTTPPRMNDLQIILNDALDCVSVCAALKSQFIPHIDHISSLEIFERNERVLILSASADCSVQLWDIYGNQMGVFGQACAL